MRADYFAHLHKVGQAICLHICFYKEVGMAATSADAKDIENALLHTLRFGGLDEENLKELVRAVAELHSKGLRNYRIFPRGIIETDGLVVKGIVDSKSLNSIFSDWILKTPRLTGLFVFPYGLPAVEQVAVTVELGETVQRSIQGGN
jgi:hypothetical protein